MRKIAGAMESEDLIDQVDKMFMESDAEIFKILHKIADLVMKGEIDE
mgnify:CR=1 FL=1